MANRSANSRAAKKEMTPASLLESAGGDSISKYRPKEIIFAQGDEADAVFYIKKGKVKITVVSTQGKEAVVAILGSDEFVGEGCLIGQPKRLATASRDDGLRDRCGSIKRNHARASRASPCFPRCLFRIFWRGTPGSKRTLIDQLFNSTEKRLARVLLLLANFGKEGRPEPMIAKISQETLAEMIGTTRSRVSHFMNKFRKAGFIDYNGHIEVHSSLLSVVLADTPRAA